MWSIPCATRIAWSAASWTRRAARRSSSSACARSTATRALRCRTGCSTRACGRSKKAVLSIRPPAPALRGRSPWPGSIAAGRVIPSPGGGDLVGSGGFEAGLIQGGERGRFAMPVPLRTDFDANALRVIARATKDGPQARRLLALAAIYEGATRTEAARIGGVTVQIVRDWVVKFNAHGPAGLVNRKPPGQPSKLTDAHRAALVARVDAGPIPAIHGVVRWRLIDLIQWIWEEFRITISKQTLSRELRAMDYRKLSARPRHHAKSEAAVAAFSTTVASMLPVWSSPGRVREGRSVDVCCGLVGLAGRLGTRT